MSLTVAITGSVVEEQKVPTAVISADPAFGVVGSIVRLDGSSSTNPTETELVFSWEFLVVPIGSSARSEGFRTLNESGSVVSFSPDVVGEYMVALSVSNGVHTSTKATAQISVRSILVPHSRGIIPDGKFIWSYIRDVWSQVESKEWFETLWSALIQLVGADMLRLYQNDFGKSIRDIQDLYQRRWLSYEPKLDLDDCTFYLGNHSAGINASTTDLNAIGQCIILPNGELVVVVGSLLTDAAGRDLRITYDTIDPSNIGTYKVLSVNQNRPSYRVRMDGLLPNLTGRILTNVGPIFSFQSTVWTFGSTIMDYALWKSESPPPIDYLPPMFSISGPSPLGNVLIGDVIHVKSGINAGFYRIVDKTFDSVTVHKKPPSSSDGTVMSDIYRPVGYRVSQAQSQVTDTVAVSYDQDIISPSPVSAGRLIVVSGMGHTITRVLTDNTQTPPLLFIGTEDGDILTGLSGASWRIPHTIVSDTQDFEQLGVSTGDLLVVDVVDVSSGMSSEVKCMVFGVRNNRVGVVITTEFPAQGEIPPIEDETYVSLSTELEIPSAVTDRSGNLLLSGEAKSLVDIIGSSQFKSSYWNTPLTAESVISVGKRKFRIVPKYVVRNRFIPVDETLKSVPSLQNWVVQPSIVKEAGITYQLKNGTKYQVEPPVGLLENIDYTIDGSIAYQGEMTFLTGTDIVESPSGHFLDRNMRPGDVFTILTPSSISGDYLVRSVVSNTVMRLQSPIPRYVLGESVTAKIRMSRKSSGTFLRFVPGLFMAKSPAPKRFWAEVSLFDNRESIENNFGLLVGLTRDDVDKISEPVNYRQAVAGLMYAFTRGTSTERIRIGAQILLGLPFAEHRGIIRSIDPDYRLDTRGNPSHGRLFIEDVDANGQAQGTYRIYVYPLDYQSRLSGIEINPATGKAYEVGDIVELFAPLCRGVQILDYLDKEYPIFGPASNIQKFNSMLLRANHNVFSADEMALVSEFLRKITPAYIHFAVAALVELVDDVVVRDRFLKRLVVKVDDNASLGLTPAIMYDGKTGWAPYAYWDDGFYWIRRAGRDLVTTYSAPPSVSSIAYSTPGFINPQFGEGPVTRVGDFLIILDGPNQGKYLITAVTDDSVTVSGLPVDGGFQSATQGYLIARRITPHLASGVGSYNGTDIVSLEPGLTADGVAIGDVLLILNSAGTAYHKRNIVRVGGTTTSDGLLPALLPGQVQIDTPILESGSSKGYAIYRMRLNYPSDLGITFTVTPSSSPSNVVSVSDLKILAMLESGDELVEDSLPNRAYTVLDPVAVYVTPQMPSSGTFRLKKKGFSSTIPFDQLYRDPDDTVSVSVLEQDASAALCASASPNVTLRTTVDGSGVYTPYDATTWVKPGDYLVLFDGANTGSYPIVQVTNTHVVLANNLTSNESSSWSIVRRA